MGGLLSWYHDPDLGGYCNHETGSHMKEDLWRYFFCACYAETRRKSKSSFRSPKLMDFPIALLPDHENIQSVIRGKKFKMSQCLGDLVDKVIHSDRFRVQPKIKSDGPSNTITSHLSHDGHAFIHYDPLQYRRLSVREAARLQTFPDNYFFEGNVGAQYHQVGNAVPPLLAHKIAAIVSDILN
jgi:DNA (cytosine-5)-methyltransferase 1